VVRVHDVITPFKFGDDRFRGFWLAGGQTLPFPIDFENRPYNTHTIVYGVIDNLALSPYPTATSPTPYDVLFSHNTCVTDRQQTDKTKCYRRNRKCGRPKTAAVFFQGSNNVIGMHVEFSGTN